MIAQNIIVSFYISNLLKYDRIYSKHLEYNTYGVKQNHQPSTLKGVSAPKVCISFLFYDTFEEL